MQKKILLFDDDYNSMASFKALLEDLGYFVVLSAEETVPQRLSEEEFHLICVDIMIHPRSPNHAGKLVNNVVYASEHWHSTGKEFAKRLRRGDYEAEHDGGTKSTVPVIILSATGDRLDNGDEESDLRVNAIYEKPFDVVELLQRIKELVGEPG